MTHVGQTATAELAVAASAAPGRLARLLGVVAVGLALLSALATFLVLANLTPIRPTDEAVTAVLACNAITASLLLGIIGWELWRVFQARRRGRAGSRLHVRIVALFSLIAAVPAILVAMVASVTFDRGLDRLFSAPTERLIQNALIVAEAYLREQARIVRADTIAVAIELTRAKPMFDENREEFHKFINFQAGVRGIPAIMMFDRDASVVDQADVKVENQNFIKPSRQALTTINENEPQIGMFLEDHHVGGLIKLRGYPDTYLYIARLLDPRVIAQLHATAEGVKWFSEMQGQRPGLQMAFALVYALIALIVLLSAIWIGLNFANYLVAPVRRLIGAAQVVSTGNLYVQVPTRRSEGDLAQLGETFNKMTADLRTQRDDIVRARDLIDSRRRFTEAVLAGASAGVIGVDAEGRIGILNRSAERLIGQSEAETLGKPLDEIVPELSELLTTARSGQRLVQGQVTISRGNRERNLSVRVTSEQSAESDHGYVVTLDDITDLVSAQRTSAWADIARRIAHEIKNPLTPIQLSAERLRRKYGKSITEDPAVFQQCTETIIRQVDDIKRMVDEFSQFARMPKAVIGSEDVADTIRQVVFLQRVGNADIQIDAEVSEDPMPARFDRRLISQALTNIVKNATEAVGAVPPTERQGPGHIRVSAFREGADIVIDVIDNGIGLPKESRSRLLEPYVTTREKGTGLGLAIVGRIAEEHGGRIELNDASAKVPGQRGAWIRLRFSAETVPAETGAKPKTQQLATNP
jgi:two-component system, NtrC family, nitrogen regulation sensor histidine kinase NtrY